MIASILTKKLESDIFSAINNNLSNFNTSLNDVPAERVSPLMKSFLYRYLLEIPPATTSKQLRSFVFIEKFFADYEKKYKAQSCAITNWILESLQNDFRSLQPTGNVVGGKQNNTKNPIEAKR